MSKPGSYGNRTNKGGKSGGSEGRAQYMSMFLAPSLYAIAKKLPPNPKVAPKVKKPRTIHQPHISDEQAMEMIRRRLAGEKLKDLASEYGISYSTALSLTNGTNRAHLLRHVETGSDIVRVFK